MPKDLPLGNGNMLIAFDKNYQLSEFYFPHVGQENHTMGHPFRLGFFIDGQFSWVTEGFDIRLNYLDDSLITQVELENKNKPVTISINDWVDFHENIYFKKFKITNLTDKAVEIRIFLGHDFYIYSHEIGDTAEFRPEVKGILHYKNDRYFLANVFANDKWGIDLYATGNKGFKDGSYFGTWQDAEDGILGQNPIAQGSVDSIIAIPLKIEAKAENTCYYTVSCGKNWEEVKTLYLLSKKKGPESFLKRTKDYWNLWVNKEPLNEKLLSPKIFNLYKKSLLIARTQINNCGSIIAANDSDTIHYNRDTYSYLWPRDGALVAYAFDLAGYSLTTNFYNFCQKIIEKEGYFLHKYTPSGTLASSWHPWLKGNQPQLPIQEDETALVIWALWNHYENFKDIEFIKPLYRSLIKKAADFMMNYRDEETGLPLPSYDLWEERQGILTFTTASVYGGLMASAHFAEIFGEKELAQDYKKGALTIRESMDRYLYLEKEGRFARMINFQKDGSIDIDATVDASLYGIFAFGAYSVDDPKVKGTMDQVFAKLWHPKTGGLRRYENDAYYRNHDDSNPWFVTSLWMAQYYIALAKKKEDLEPALKIMNWVVDHANPSGVLAEQISPFSGEPLSVSPLTWSHAAFIIVVQEYLNKLVSIEKCHHCGLSKISKFA